MPTFTFELEHPDKGTRAQTLSKPTLEEAMDAVHTGGWRVKRQLHNPGARRAAAPPPPPSTLTKRDVHEAVFWALIKAWFVMGLIVAVIWLLAAYAAQSQG